MSRHSGECFAEVTFETQAGRYRCHWSQHRARKKPGGELQSPRHEIADADSGEIFEAKIRGVASRIETATGMDFEQFTRSMLLAQGGFAAFLQASTDERAPILEQITGTEIYSRISIRVHERRSDERKTLDTLLAALAGMQPLDPEDEARLTGSLEQKIRQDAKLRRRIDENHRAITWLDGIAQLEAASRQLEQQQNNLRARIDGFTPEQTRLDSAIRALELAGEYATLVSMRREQEAERRHLAEYQGSLPTHEAVVKQANDAMAVATGGLDTRKAEQQEALPVIRKAREMDLKIREKDAPIAAASDTISEHKKSLDARHPKQNRDLAELDAGRKALTRLQRQLDETKADEALVEHLTGIRGRFESLRNLHGQLEDKREALHQADSRLLDATGLWGKQTKNLDIRKRAMDDIQGALAQQESAFEDIVGDRTLSDWRHDLASLTARQTVLVRAREAAGTLLKLQQALDELGKRKAALIADESTLAARLKTETERQSVLEKEMALLETQLSLLKRIEGFGKSRHQLQDGEPCPLCGAREHPFAEGNIPATDETRQRLSAIRADLKATMGAVSDARVEQARVAKDLAQIALNQGEHTEKITESEKLIASCDLDPFVDRAVGDHCSDSGYGGLGKELDRCQGENKTELAHAAKIVQGAETIEKEFQGRRKSLEVARESVAKAERSTQSAAHDKDSASQSRERIGQETALLHAQQENALARLRQDVAAFGIEDLSVVDLASIQVQLTARRDQWISRQKEQSALDGKIAALEIQTHHRAERIRAMEDEIGKQRQRLDGLLAERETLGDERREIFGDKNTDDEERRLADAIEAADKDLDAARRKLIGANQG
ncbi:MAG: hypothetical protein KJO08_11325, partial [Gammaproteobacteria bacterium]|nr:hypothetical protein [Gammaproteobacteria bacterium]